MPECAVGTRARFGASLLLGATRRDIWANYPGVHRHKDDTLSGRDPPGFADYFIPESDELGLC